MLQCPDGIPGTRVSLAFSSQHGLLCPFPPLSACPRPPSSPHDHDPLTEGQALPFLKALFISPVALVTQHSVFSCISLTFYLHSPGMNEGRIWFDYFCVSSSQTAALPPPCSKLERYFIFIQFEILPNFPFNFFFYPTV